jgi:hypothetical protein
MNYNSKYFIAASITKSERMEDAGLHICEYNGEYIIYDVSGVFDKFTDVKKGSRLLKLQEKDVHEYASVDDIKKVLNDSKIVSIEAVKIPGFDEILNDSSVSESEGFQLDEGIPVENSHT